MEHIHPSETTLQRTVAPLPLPEQTEVKKAHPLSTLHLKVLSGATSFAAKVTKSRLFVPVTTLGWLSCAAVNRLFKATTWALETAKKGEEAYAFSREVQQLTHDLITSSQTVRDERQAALETVTAGAQAIPIVGNVVGIATRIAAKERDAERAVTWWANRYTKGVFDFLRYSAPYILSGLHTLSKAGERATSLAVGNISEKLSNAADRIEAIRYRALHPKPAQEIALTKKVALPEEHQELSLINLKKLYSLVGPHVVSTGLIYSSAKTGASFLHTLADASRQLFETIGASRLNSWFAYGLDKAALGLELLMILPYGKQFTATLLENAGVPVYEVEKTFAKLPEFVTKQAVTIEGKLLDAVRSLDQKIKTIDDASHLSALQAEKALLQNDTENALMAFSKAITEACKTKSQELFCQSHVFELLKSKEALIAYAKQLGLDHTGQEFFAAIQELASTGQVQEAAIKQASSWRSWFEQGLTSFSQTRVGKGIEHLSKAAIPYVQKSYETAANQVKGLFSTKSRLTPDVQLQLDKWQDKMAALAAVREKCMSAELSQAAIVELGGIWGALLQQATSNDPFSRFLRDTYMNSVRPTLEKAMTALDSLHQLNLANYNFLSAQLDANLQTELQMQEYLQQKAKIAHKAAQDSSQGIMSQTLSGVTSWGLPILSWFFLSSQTLTVLPFIMQRIVPHVLRASSEHIQNGAMPFWFTLAHSSQKVLNKGAFYLGESNSPVGSWLQSTFNKQIAQVTGSYFIDPKRIDNFKALSEEEQAYLFKRTNTPEEGYHKKVEECLKRLDALYIPDHEEKPLELSAYFQLPTSQQEDILFAVAHSEAYKHYMDPDPEHIVHKFNKLPKSEREGLTKKYSKMTHADKERVRLAIAKNAHLFSGTLEGTFNHPIGWELEAAKSLTHTTNHRLKIILELYARLAPEEKAIMTPHRVSKMSKEKLEHLQELIETYHPEFADALRPHTNMALASLYNMLPAGQKAKLLELTADELHAASPETKRELTLFLMHAANMPEDGDLLTTFNSLDRLKQAEFRESKELSQVQKETIIQTVEKEIANTALKLRALERRIERLSDTEYLSLKEEIRIKSLGLEDKKTAHAATTSALKALKEANAPKHAITKLTHALAKNEADQKTLSGELETARQKLASIESKLTSLHELEDEYLTKLASLNAILGKELEEAPKESQVVDETLKKTIHEVGKSMMHALVATSQKEGPNAVIFSKKVLDEAIVLRQKQLTACEARIKQLKSEITYLRKQNAYEALAEKRMQLRAHTTFTLKLNQALFDKFIELRKQFDVHVTMSAPAA